MPSHTRGGGGFEGGIPAEQINQDATHRFVSDAEKSAWNNPTIPIKSVNSNSYTMNGQEGFLYIKPKSGTQVMLYLPFNAPVGRVYRIFKHDDCELLLTPTNQKGIYSMESPFLLGGIIIRPGALITAIFDGTGWFVYPQQ